MAIPAQRCFECGCTQKQNPDKPFCMECGHRAQSHAAVCGQCAQPLGDSTAFCQHCGASIERVIVPPPPRPDAPQTPPLPAAPASASQSGTPAPAPVTASSSGTASTPTPARRPGLMPKPLTVVPKGLLWAAWIAAIFGVLSVIVGFAGYSSSSSSSDTFGNQINDAANTASLIAGIGVGAAWFMLSCFCAGLHGHLDRMTRATLERPK